MIELVNRDIKNERFILVSENKSFKEILYAVAKSLGKKVPTKKVKPWETALFWRWEWLFSRVTGKEPRMTKQSAKSLYSETHYSSEKIEKKLNFTFEKIDKIIEKISKDFLLKI